MSKADFIWRGKNYKILSYPFPHIIVRTKKELHGWWPGKRECTSERFLINPYLGCSIGCVFCYANSFPGWFQVFRRHSIVVVAEDFDRIIDEQLNAIDVACCGYLSPVTDPFQPLNEKLQLSEKIIAKFVEKNIPIEFITKAKVPEGVLEMLETNKHNFGQVSILSLNHNLNNLLTPRAAPIKELFGNIFRMARRNIFSVLRIDPIFPYLTDDKSALHELMQRACDSGVKHIIASILDIPVTIKKDIFFFIKKNFGLGLLSKYQKLYRERIDNYFNAELNYRLSIFDYLRKEADKLKISFALCMEYKLIAKGKTEGLNKYFMSSPNCEGINIPIYKRNGKKFYPIYNCLGNCLNCWEARCGITDLAMAKEGSKKDWKLKDYKRWSRKLNG